MKKIIYSITILCLMFFGMNSVFAAGDVRLSTNNITIEEGATETFDLITDNTLVRANIVSKNSSIVKVNGSDYLLTSGEGDGKVLNYPISITAAGKVGDTTTVEVDIFDASTFDGVEIANDNNHKILTVTVTIVAKSVAPVNTYTVIYDANPGTTEKSLEKIEKGNPVTLPSASRKDYEFLGWSTTDNESDIVGKAGGSYTPEGNITLYAIWQKKVAEEPKTYFIVTYNSNLGVASKTTEKVEEGSSVTLPSAERDGYEFLGWSTTDNESGIIGKAGETYDPKANITLTAIWKKNGGVVEPVATYTVTYDANGGTGEPVVQTKNKGEDITLSNKKPTKDKHEFLEWNTSADGNGTRYLPGGKYALDANVTLYAQWKLVENVDKNPQTGDSKIFIILAILLTFGGYAYWYNKKTKEN